MHYLDTLACKSGLMFFVWALEIPLFKQAKLGILKSPQTSLLCSCLVFTGKDVQPLMFLLSVLSAKTLHPKFKKTSSIQSLQC